MDEVNSSDDEGYVGLHRALPIEPLPKDFNPKKMPATAQEYIHHVMYEASKCSPVTIAKHLNLAPLRTSGKVEIKPELSTGGFVSSVEWENYQLHIFGNLTRILHKRRMENQLYKCDIPLLNLPSNKWIKWLQETRPLLSVILALNQRVLHHILRVLLTHLSVTSNKLQLQHGEWVYAVCAGLEQPLDMTPCGDLRDIAREFSTRRETLTDEDVKERRMLNLIICIVVKHFKQFDLIS